MTSASASQRDARGRHRPRRITRAVVAIASFGIVAAWVTLALGQFDIGLVSALASPWTTQLLWPLAPAIVLLFLLRRRVIATVGTLAVLGVLGVHAVAPRAAPFDASTDRSAMELRVVVANVLARTREHARFLEWIEIVEPDIVVVIECPPMLAAVLDAKFAHAFARPQDDPSGIAVFSRHALLDRREIAIDPQGFPTLAMRVSPTSAPAFDLEAVHPYPPVGLRSVARRNEELATIAARHADRPADAPPLLVAGDFNAPTVDPRMRDLLARADLRDTRPYWRTIAGTLGTWPSTVPFSRLRTPAVLRTPIDHCLVCPAWRVASIETGPEIGSDHRPILVDLAMVESALPAPGGLGADAAAATLDR